MCLHLRVHCYYEIHVPYFLTWGRETGRKCIKLRKEELRHEYGDIAYSSLCFPSQEEQLKSTQDHDTTERILQQKNEVKQHPLLRDQDELKGKGCSY